MFDSILSELRQALRIGTAIRIHMSTGSMMAVQTQNATPEDMERVIQLLDDNVRRVDIATGWGWRQVWPVYHNK